MAAKSKVQPYDGYPQIQQDVSTAAELSVVITQQQVRSWQGTAFLQPMRYVRMKEDTCCGRQLNVYDESGKMLGYSDEPCCNPGPCESTEIIDVQIPAGNRVMQNRHKPELCPGCNECQDVVIMDIHDHSKAKIGSFEYSPVYCRCEPKFCKGQHVIKDHSGQKIMYIKRPKCIISCCGYLCKRQRCHAEECCSGGCCTRDPWSISTEVLDFADDSTVSFVREIIDPEACCPTTEYRVDYEREGESEENKALIYGTALAIDKNGLGGSLATVFAFESRDMLV